MLFCDREAILKEDSPGGEWSLHIYGPINLDPALRPPDEPPFYASFMKRSKETITAIPFGAEVDPSTVSVKWEDEGRRICYIYIGDDCYAMFLYGTWRAQRRGFFRIAPQLPFGEQEIAEMRERGFIKET